MGKLKKQTKASRARRLNMKKPLGSGDAMIDDEETPYQLPVSLEAEDKPQYRCPGSVEPVGPKKVSSVTGETQGAMKTRQALEWKKIRQEIEDLKVQRRKIRKTEPGGAKKRKELSDRIKWLKVQYQGRVESERATLQDVKYPSVKESRELERKEEEAKSLREEVEMMKQQIAQMQSMLMHNMS